MPPPPVELKGFSNRAYEALERVAAQDGQASTRWLRAQWAWEDKQAAIAHRWWSQAIEADSSGRARQRGQLSISALHALASHAARIEAPAVALHVLQELVERDPADVVAYWKQAQIALTDQADHGKAVRLLQEATKHDERLGSCEEPPRWKVWSTLATSQAILGDEAAALESMAEAIRGIFSSTTPTGLRWTAPNLCSPSPCGFGGPNLPRYYTVTTSPNVLFSALRQSLKLRNLLNSTPAVQAG